MEFFRYLICTIIMLIAGKTLSAQEVYLIEFHQRSADSSRLPELHPKAIERRLKHTGRVYSSTDFPPRRSDVKSILPYLDSLRYTLRWLNAVSVSTDPQRALQIAKLPGVKSVKPLHNLMQVSQAKNTSRILDSDDLLLRQVRGLMNLDSLKSNDLTGKGIRIAVLDAGFKDVDQHSAFQHIREDSRIIAQKDFYRNRGNVYRGSKHGTAVLSCIAGYYEENLIGAAPDAEFLLARTEHWLWEKEIEEDHWLAAAEWSENMGADILNSSLGYGKKRYEYSDLTGNATPVSRAARIAVRKGVLVVNSAGNEGAGKFKFINAPADVDSVLSVGASFPMIKIAMPFSSFGPNFSRQLKPEIMAPGYVLGARPRGKYSAHSGTSFAAPLVSGFAACLMQKYPEKTNMEIRDMILRSSHLYPYYDYVNGYGVPDAMNILNDVDEWAPAFEVIEKTDSITFIFDQAVINNDENSKGIPFYYHVEGDSSRLIAYQFDILPVGTAAYKLPASILKMGLLRVACSGTIWDESEGLKQSGMPVVDK